jgi:hypothetical protein
MTCMPLNRRSVAWSLVAALNAPTLSAIKRSRHGGACYLRRSYDDRHVKPGRSTTRNGHRNLLAPRDDAMRQAVYNKKTDDIVRGSTPPPSETLPSRSDDIFMRARPSRWRRIDVAAVGTPSCAEVHRTI